MNTVKSGHKPFWCNFFATPNDIISPHVVRYKHETRAVQPVHVVLMLNAIQIQLFPTNHSITMD